MRFRFNPYRLLFPAADASPPNAPPEGVHNLKGDHSASTLTSPTPVEAVDVLADNRSNLASAPTSSPAVMESLKLSPITIPTARLQSLQLPPRIFATIGADIGSVTRVATTSKDSRVARVVFGSSPSRIFAALSCCASLSAFSFTVFKSSH